MADRQHGTGEIKVRQSEQWFIDRVGQFIMAKSDRAYNGQMKVDDVDHAKHLYNVSQNHQGYQFTDI